MPAVVRERHNLALRLGMTVGELERRMTVDELNGWRRYFASGGT